MIFRSDRIKRQNSAVWWEKVMSKNSVIANSEQILDILGANLQNVFVSCVTFKLA